MRQLDGRDAAFLQLESMAAPMHLGALTLYDPGSVPTGRQRFRAILDTIDSRLHLAPSLRRRLCSVPLGVDHPWWVEDADFDLEFHVRHVALPRPGDWRQLCIQTARLHARPLDLSRPPWEFTVIEGLDGIEGLPAGAYAVLSKVHLAAVPALLRSEIFESLHDQVPAGAPVAPPVRPWRGESAPTAPGLLARAWFNAVRSPLRTAGAAASSIPLLTEAARRLREPTVARRGRGPVAPATRFNGRISPHRVFDAQVFELAAIGRIRRAVPDASVHDVVLAICGGALRRQLLAAGELPGPSLVALAPLPVSGGRGGVGRKGHARRAASEDGLVPLTVALGTHLPDPLQRLHCIQAEQRAGLKAAGVSGPLLGARMLTDSTRFAPTAVAGMAARLYLRTGLAPRTRPRFNCVVMNVPGPQLPRYSAGARMLLQYGLGPLQDGTGLLFTAFSYCGYLTLSFTACREQLPVPASFAAALQTAFDELLEAATGELGAGTDAAPAASAAASARDGQGCESASAFGPDLDLDPGSGPGPAARHVGALSASLGHDLLVAARTRSGKNGQHTDGSDPP